MGALLIAGMAAWTGVTQTSFFGELVKGGGPAKCSGTLAPGTYSGVVVQSGNTCTINSSDVITGNVSVNSNATLNDQGSSIGGNLAVGSNSNLFVSPSGGYARTTASINGNLTTSGASVVSVNQATIGGNVTVQGTIRSTSTAACVRALLLLVRSSRSAVTMATFNDCRIG